MQQKPANASLREFDFDYYLTRYLNLLWRWKWYILLSGPIVAIGWIIYFLNFGTVRPDLDAMATVAIEDAQNLSAVRDVGSAAESGVELMRSRNFLTMIVNKLSLRLVIPEYQRHQVFDSVSVDSTAPSGVYVFEVTPDKKGYELYFWGREFGPDKKLLESGEILKLSSFTRNGVYVHFAQSFLKEPVSFNYTIVQKRAAVERLRKTVIIQNGTLSSGANFCNIISKGKDYPMITKTVNLIANEFVDLSLGSKRRRATELIDVLEKQLATATEQLRIAQDSADNFRRRFPNVGLGAEMMSNVQSIASLESGSVNNSASAEEAQRLRSRLAMATNNDLALYVSEALIFLSARGVTAAAVLQQEFAQLSARQQQLIAGYDKSHPFVQENLNQILEVRSKTDALLSEYTENASNISLNQRNQVAGLTSRLHGLPVLQSRLAELERQVQVNSQIHSTILSRYNQAKIADAVKVEGVYVMDYAVEPEPLSDFMNKVIKMLIGVLIGLCVSIVPPILFDVLDKTVRTENDLSKMLEFTVLESIPEIKGKNKTKVKKVKGKSGVPPKIREVDEKLITADYSPNYTNELFRSLRAKIMLRMHDIEKKLIVVSSYGMSEGKSLISSNVSITMAQQQLRTVLIDGDIRRGVLHNSFVLNKKPGLANFLFSDEPVTIDSVKMLLQKTHVPNLSIISSGVNVPNPSELLSLPRFKDLLEILKELHDVIVFDTPPLGVAADAAIVSKMFNGSIVVVKAGHTNVISLRKKLQEYPSFKKNVIGTILNGALFDRKMREYKYSAYHY